MGKNGTRKVELAGVTSCDFKKRVEIEQRLEVFVGDSHLDVRSKSIAGGGGEQCKCSKLCHRAGVFSELPKANVWNEVSE